MPKYTIIFAILIIVASLLAGCGSMYTGEVISYSAEEGTLRTAGFKSPEIPINQHKDSVNFQSKLAGTWGAPSATQKQQTLASSQGVHVSSAANNTLTGKRWIFKKNKTINRNAIGVVIGNRNYSNYSPDVPNVDFAINDSTAIKEYLVDALGYREGNIIYLEDATQAEMMSVFGSREHPKGRLFDLVQRGKSDVFIYYSGHGAPSLESGRGYLLPVDAHPQKIDINGYALDDLYRNIELLQAKRATVVIDACFSGNTQGGTLVKNASSIALVLKTSPPRSADILTAADTTEVASWDADAKHGLFTRYFLDGVAGAADKEEFGNVNGIVTLDELKKFLEDEVTYNARLKYGRKQSPQISGNAGREFSSLNVQNSGPKFAW